MLQQFDGAPLFGIGDGGNLKAGCVYTAAGCATGIAHDGRQLVQQGGEGMRWRAVIERAGAGFTFGAGGAPCRRHWIAGRLGGLLGIGKEQLAPG